MYHVMFYYVMVVLSLCFVMLWLCYRYVCCVMLILCHFILLVCRGNVMFVLL
jgi:hypothetical protein